MHNYDLSSEEGVLLMCVAEALLRIGQADRGQADPATNWATRTGKHLGSSDSLFVEIMPRPGD